MKKILYSLAVLALAAACGQNAFTIKGTVENPEALPEGSLVYLYDGQTALDSTTVTDGAFSFDFSGFFGLLTRENGCDRYYLNDGTALGAFTAPMPAQTQRRVLSSAGSVGLTGNSLPPTKTRGADVTCSASVSVRPSRPAGASNRYSIVVGPAAQKSTGSRTYQLIEFGNAFAFCSRVRSSHSGWA